MDAQPKEKLKDCLRIMNELTNQYGFQAAASAMEMASSSDTRLSIDTTGYEIEGKKGTWLAQDYILMNEKKLVPDGT